MSPGQARRGAGSFTSHIALSSHPAGCSWAILGRTYLQSQFASLIRVILAAVWAEILGARGFERWFFTGPTRIWVQGECPWDWEVQSLEPAAVWSALPLPDALLCRPSCPPAVHRHRAAVHGGGSHQRGPGRERWATKLLCLCCRVSYKSLVSSGGVHGRLEAARDSPALGPLVTRSSPNAVS